jgi:hypothetical protein
MAQGALTKFGIHTALPVTSAFEATSFGLESRRPHISANGLRGTRSQVAQRVIEGVEECDGPIVVMPNLTEAALLLAWGGFLNTSNVFTLTEALTSRYVVADKVTKVHTFSGVYVGRLGIRMVKNVPWEWTLGTVGQQRTIGNAGTFPAISLTEAPPLALHHMVVSLLGSARSVMEVNIGIDHALDVQANNAAFNEQIEPGDRIISVGLTLPYTAANADLVEQSVEGDEAATAEATYGGLSADFAFGNLKFPRGAVPVQGKNGLVLQLDGQAFMTGSTRELVITLDSTP